MIVFLQHGKGMRAFWINAPWPTWHHGHDGVRVAIVSNTSVCHSAILDSQSSSYVVTF